MYDDDDIFTSVHKCGKPRAKDITRTGFYAEGYYSSATRGLYKTCIHMVPSAFYNLS